MLLVAVILPFAAAILVALFGQSLRQRLGYVVALAPLSLAVYFASFLGARGSGPLASLRMDWVPALGLELFLVLDGFRALFALLITAIGLLVVLYSVPYLGGKEELPRFYAAILLFMGAMLGVVLSGNLLLLYVFWELTSVSSFLLIGYWYERPGSIYGALKALQLTIGAGMAMLVGFIFLGLAGGTHDLMVLAQRSDAVLAHPLAGAALILILVGAAAKSAQAPFHIWLPDAMAAPTPVSAYLHSATMVKAGLFLVGVLWPVLSPHPYWTPVVAGFGFVTMVLGGYLTLRCTDLKALLAMSTVSQLGLIMSLFGLGTAAALEAGIFHVFSHAAFKGALFMVVGIIDHETGTRDARVLRGLGRKMPYTFALAAVSALSMMGAPPLSGFLSKELFLAATLEPAGWAGWLLPVVATLASVLTVAYSLVVGFRLFTGPLPAEGMPKQPHEPPWSMLLPPAALVLLTLATGLVPALVEGPLLRPAAAALLGRPSHLHAVLWHGFSLPLLLSAVAWAAGYGLFRWWDRAAALAGRLQPPVHANRIFDAYLTGVEPAAKWVTRLHMTGHLRDYIAITGLAVAGAWTLAWARTGWRLGTLDLAPVSWSEVALAVLVVVATAATLWARRSLAVILFLGAVGAATVLLWVLFRNPDLALTQLGVEALMALMLLLILGHLPALVPETTSRARRWQDVVLACMMGTLAFGLTLMANGTRLGEPISTYFTAQSVPAAGGHNIVNVILVDFRGLDTMLEITVLGTAGIAMLALLLLTGFKRDDDAQEDVTPILRTGAHALFYMVQVVAIWLFLRGHNAPGGGFIAGLTSGGALVLYALAFGPRRAGAMVRPDSPTLIGLGVLLAVGTGLGAAMLGAPFLTHVLADVHLPLIGELELGTALVFDAGVYLVVLGVAKVVLLFMRVADEPTRLAQRVTR